MCCLAVAADALRRDPVTLPSAIRWVRRRVRLVRPLLTIVVGLLPQSLLGCVPAYSGETCANEFTCGFTPHALEGSDRGSL